jgi:nitrogen regulatory protein P-II 1
VTEPAARPEPRPLPEGAVARLVAIVRASHVDAIMEALSPLALRDVLVEPVRGYNRQKSHLAEYEELALEGGFLPKVRLQFVVDGAGLPPAVAAITEAARTGRIGDGKIFVHLVEPAARAGTG